MEELFLFCRGVLSEQLNLDAQEIKMDSTFESIDADSIDIVEMIMAVEDKYDVEFPEEDLEEYPTMASLIKVLHDFLEQVKR